MLLGAVIGDEDAIDMPEQVVGPVSHPGARQKGDELLGGLAVLVVDPSDLDSLDGVHARLPEAGGRPGVAVAPVMQQRAEGGPVEQGDARHHTDAGHSASLALTRAVRRRRSGACWPWPRGDPPWG